MGLVTLSTAVFLLDGIRRAFQEGPEIVVLAAEARGLVPGSDVWVAGSPSGRVKSVVFADPHGPTESRVVIRATLNRTAVPFLRADTRASISSAALLAPLVLKLDPGHPGSGPLDFTDTLRVPPERSTEQMLSLARQARDATDSLTLLAQMLRRRITVGPGTVAGFRNDTVLLQRLWSIAGNARSLSRALDSEDALPARLASDSLGVALARMASSLRSLQGEERAENVTEAVVDLAQRLERISENLDMLDRDLRAGRGTAGRALYDDEISRQQEAFQARLDSLKSELIRKPWRWLRFKLF